MGNDTTYAVEIAGETLASALIQLDVVDSRSAGAVHLIFDGNILSIARSNRKRELAQVDIPACGYFPVSVQCLWKRFRLLLNGHSPLVRIVLLLDNHGKGTLKIDNMVVDYEPLSEQFALPFGVTPPAIQESLGDQLVKRLAELDTENEATGTQQLELSVKRYERDQKLVRLIKLLRGSQCQICGFSFKMKSGDDYSECHHLEHLAKQGLDVSRNMLVLCANHHRQFHYGNVKILSHTQDQVEFTIDGTRHICSLQLVSGSQPQAY